MTFSSIKHLNGCSLFYYKLWLLSDHDPCVNAAIEYTLLTFIYISDPLWALSHGHTKPVWRIHMRT